MDWKSIYIVYRISENSDLLEVFHSDDIKKAKYWLQYIAQPGDVLTRTPLHPKHSKTNLTAEYWSHKEKSGKLYSQIDRWLKYLENRKIHVTFPSEQKEHIGEGQ